ncbi:MAG: ABC transporter permease [Deltaproteobacteria bacterium RBG_16_47_11]|nr:MAG: ABC transporter permease [Deltaproteobacteria bacterium RBG_16_47_11]
MTLHVKRWAKSPNFPFYCFVLSLFFVPLFLQDPYFIHQLIFICLFAYLSASWNIIGGYAGQTSLGHSAFVGIGAYVSTLLFINLGLTPWVGMFAGGLAATLVSLIIGFPAFRLTGPYFALTTIAFCEILRLWVTDTETLLGISLKGARGILLPIKGHSPYDFQFVDKVYYYYIILMMMVLILYVCYKIENSKMGYYLRAIKGNQEAARSLGVEVTQYKLLAFAISAFFTGMGGVFYAQMVLFIIPERILGLDISIELALITIIGGRGTLFGPIFGAFLLRPLSEITAAYFGGTYLGVHLILYGVLLMVSILFIPKGMTELFNRLYLKLIRSL